MNDTLFRAARDAGCTRAESELLAVYVTVDSIKQAAYIVGTAEGSARNHLTRMRQRIGAPHTAAMVAKLLA